MNVGELKRYLATIPDDLPVCVEGFEGGITEHVELEVTAILRDRHRDPWHGEHERDWWDDSPDFALILSRNPMLAVVKRRTKRPRKKSRKSVDKLI